MPTYAYACKDCGHAFDIQQSFSDDSLTVCPECEGALRKKFNSVGVVFKGSGFYRTDSRDSKGSSTVAAVKDSGSKSESSTPAAASSSAPSSASSAPAKTPAAAAS